MSFKKSRENEKKILLWCGFWQKSTLDSRYIWISVWNSVFYPTQEYVGSAGSFMKCFAFLIRLVKLYSRVIVNFVKSDY